jgi:hypothetical protein
VQKTKIGYLEMPRVREKDVRDFQVAEREKKKMILETRGARGGKTDE